MVHELEHHGAFLRSYCGCFVHGSMHESVHETISPACHLSQRNTWVFSSRLTDFMGKHFVAVFFRTGETEKQGLFRQSQSFARRRG